jgi:hypothetical protein
MVKTLPEPEVVRCYFDDGFDPRVPAMCLRWRPESFGQTDRLWELPEGLCLAGPAPERFGVNIQRQSADSYAVQLLWDRTRLIWPDLNRAQLLTSCLAPLLGALGTDLWYLLDQPIEAERGSTCRAA